VKIGVIVSSDTNGGAEQVIRSLATRAAKFDIESSLIGAIPDWDSTGCPSVGITLGPKLSRSKLLRSIVTVPKDIRSLRKLDLSGFDCFHLHFKREQIFFTAFLSKHAPVVWTEHGRFPTHKGPHLLATLYRRSASAVTRICCVSETVAVDIIRVVGSTERILVVENAVDTDLFRPPDAAEKASARDSCGAGNRITAIVVARLDPAKKIDRAIEFAARMRLDLSIAGSGSDLEHLKSVASRLPGSSIRFLGHVTNVRNLCWAADCGIYCPAWYEGDSLTVREMASTGLPIIAFDGGALSRGLMESGGVAFASQMEHSIDTELLAEMSRKSTKWAKERTIDSWVDTWVTLYNSLVSRNDC
jgi:glycosyltransferase involved in cell wall biosynthesis